jgi:anti-sigma regulatory factor (Ser/Thr protein kinase)
VNVPPPPRGAPGFVASLPPGVLSEGDAVQASHSLRLEPVPRSTGRARRFVRSHAPELPAETEASLVLLTSELVTNAVLHARTTIEVGIVIGRRSVVVGVHDLDLATPLQDPYPDREGGWGHALVDALAESWSTTRHPGGGKTVWFRLCLGDAHAVADGVAARADADRRDS